MTQQTLSVAYDGISFTFEDGVLSIRVSPDHGYTTTISGIWDLTEKDAKELSSFFEMVEKEIATSV